MMCLFFLLVHAQLVNSSGSILANCVKSNNVIWPANSSGDIRNALKITESIPIIEEFNGKLCVLFGGVEPRLFLDRKINYII